MPNQFSQLFGGLTPQTNTPKFQFLKNYGNSNPLTGYPGTTAASIPTGPMSVAPRQSTPTSSSGATAPKPTSLQTPAAKTYIASQTNQPNQVMPAGTDTPGYTVDASNPTPTNAPITGDVQTPSGATINATSGAITKAAPTPAIDPNASYRDAFNTYLASLQPNANVTTATNKLNADTLQSQKDEQDALDKGETQGFATAEAARVNRNNSFQTTADANALNALTGNQTATTDASKARVDFEKSLLPSTDNFNLSPGETRYDSSGNPIASAPATASAPKIIGDSSSGYYTVGDDGKLTQLLGATPAKLSPSEQQSQQTQAQNDDVASAVVDFETQMQQKGWRGANPDAYNYYRSELTKLYGASAALALDKAMKDAGIEVDYVK